ncbi:DUF6133 family protein [Candidatus Merdisoma sp. JLR.KK006]|jgi:hypothetical protein|uniref:DUF6133 family protein n=1 Tax=Candidatus Merdisoma sp. JLR.KK006 TaxID=3112626 RepID=UPI00136193C3|nr:DUF6133 family protein [Bacteroides intestinalis]NBH26845.1 hypothetical protein [Lachnospiraceae bacterium]
MKKILKKIENKGQSARNKIQNVIQDQTGENYVDVGVKILIAVVIGALLLAGLYALFGDVVMPTLEQRITEMFNYAG